MIKIVLTHSAFQMLKSYQLLACNQFLQNKKGRELIMTNENKTKPFGLVDKIGYLFGDFGNDFTFGLSSMFLMKFYSDVMGVDPKLVGLMMMAARIIDAFTDVAMGQIVDRSKPTEKGKFIPWLKRMSGPVCVASFLMYATWFQNMPMAFKVFWMFFSYILWGSICYTGVNIPFGSMASAITPDPKERASLSTWRSMGGMLANMFISVVLPLIVYYTDAAGNKVLSGSRMAIGAAICSICAFICYALCCKLSTERVKVEQMTEKFSFVQLLKSLATNRSLLGIVIASIFVLLSQLTLQGMVSYVFPNYFKSVEAMSAAGAVMFPAMLLIAAIATPVSAKIGRKAFAIIGMAIGAALLILAYFMHITNPWIFVGIYGLAWIGMAIFSMICWAMITDVIDDSEVQKGVRSDGTIYAVYSFARKLGQAASAGLMGGLLSMIGYTKATAFDPAVTEKIYGLTCLAPAIGFIAVILVLLFLYPLSKKRVEENVRILAERHKKEQ